MFSFLDLPLTPQVIGYVTSHAFRHPPTDVEPDKYSTVRLSADQAFAWTKRFEDWQLIENVQRACKMSMDLLGYISVADEIALRRDEGHLLRDSYDLRVLT